MFLISTGKQRQEARTQKQPDCAKPECKRRKQACLKLVLMMASTPFSTVPVNCAAKGFLRVWKWHTLLPVKSLLSLPGNIICRLRTWARGVLVTCTGTFKLVPGTMCLLCLLAQTCLVWALCSGTITTLDTSGWISWYQGVEGDQAGGETSCNLSDSVHSAPLCSK